MTTEEITAMKAELCSKTHYDFNDLVHIMTLLRSPGGCLWDIEQTHESIRDNLIEEAYEVVEAIDNNDLHLMQEELGDLLLQVIFQARIAEEEEAFDITNVVNDICKKLVHRHPHVFGSVVAHTAEEMLANWEKIKIEEKQRETLVSRLEAVPPQLPALLRASKIAKKTAFFFGPETLDEAYADVRSALDRLEKAEANQKETETGRFLYAASVLCRQLSVSGEAALTAEIKSKINKIRRAEALTEIPLEELSKEERDALRRRLAELD